ncbi:MAG: 2-succinyl-5-enolpyruvyl-6-hydroxy-3-cyclohexene-1-carboxylic-acid synthase [Solirubrobacterales bacterium]
MELTNQTFAPLRVMIDEFVRAGVEHAVVAPGSRNAPIAYALGDREELKKWSVLDERQAGFFALGIAKSTGKPVIVTCTSGSAAANLHSAVIEASHAGVPLIVLTADRPPELRDVGAGQAIDQLGIYGASVRWFVEAGNHPVTNNTLRHFRALAGRALGEAGGANPGPVHINLPLREPLQPVLHDLGDLGSQDGATGRPGGEPWSAARIPAPVAPDLHSAVAKASHPVIVAGDQHTPELAAAIAEYSAAAGIPVFADSLSQLRRAHLAQGSHVIASYDLILRSEPVKHELIPDLIVRVGELPTSKPLRAWLSETSARQIVLDPRGRWQDPTRRASDLWQVDPLATIARASADADSVTAAPPWTAAWSRLERAAQSAIDHALGEESFPFEPAVYRELLSKLSAATVFVSSSMPIRDVETYGPIGADDLRFLSNRGTNGIDGVLSTALGVRAPFDCDRVVLLTGDLAFLYDASALAIAKRHELPITIVCVDNGGGGIFSFLPVAAHEQHFEELIATPPGVDIEAVARAYGMDYSAPQASDALIEAASRPGLVHVKTDRTENKTQHDRVASHVLESVAAALTESGAFH